MMPPVVDPNTASPGEIEIFHRLQREPDTLDWIVLHSVDLANHATQISGEIDFVAVVPHLGVLCVEVKAHRTISRSDGMWYYGRDSPGDPRGPFRQASAGMHSMRNELIKTHPQLSRIVFWSVVVFPYVRFNQKSEEWHPWQLVDGPQFRSAPLGESLRRSLQAARDHLVGSPSARWFRPDSPSPTEEECEEIARALRPDFEVYESPRSRRLRVQEELKVYTAEQFEVLDRLEDNDRLIVKGPAGTGKTLLAIEAARRSASLGRKTSLLCYNHLLGRYLSDQMGGSLGGYVGTLHGYMLSVCGSRTPGAADRHFWEEALPNQTVDVLLGEQANQHRTEVLVIDEAQDVLRNSYLDVLDLSVEGGLAAGRWRMFGDFEKQALFDAADIPLEDFLARRAPNTTRCNLRTNCRNTPRLATVTQILAGLDPPYSRVARPDSGVEVEIRYYGTPEEQVTQLVGALDTLETEGYGASDIVLLSGRRDAAYLDLPEGRWRDRMTPAAEPKRGGMQYSTIQAFKGLEASAVLVTDIDEIDGERAQALFYVAVTRAIDRLFLFVSGNARSQMIRLLTGTQTALPGTRD